MASAVHVSRVGIPLTLLLFTASPAALAQGRMPLPDDRWRWFEASLGATIGGASSVNQRPVCDQQAIPCSGAAGPARGGLLSLGGNLRDGLAMVGTVNLYSRLYDSYAPGPHREEIWFVMAGAQVATPFGSGPGRRSTRVFGHALAGVSQRTFVGRSDPVAQGPGWQLGAGVDRRFSGASDPVMVRAEVDYRRFQGSAKELTGWLGAVGLTYEFGTRLPDPRPPLRTQGRTQRRPDPEPRPLGEVPPFEIAAGVSLQGPKDANLPPLCGALGLPCGSPRTFPDLGLSLTAARHFFDWFGIVGEADIYGNQWRTSSAKEGLHTNHVRSALAGVRAGTPQLYVGRSRTGIRLFGQILAGPQWSSIAPPRRAVQAGLGIDAITQRGITVRWQFDYCLAPGPVRDLSTGRALIAVVFGR